jgi:hypothetical protein
MYTSLAIVVIHIVLIHKLTIRSKISCSDLLPTASVLIPGGEHLTRPRQHPTPTTLHRLAIHINNLQDHWLLLYITVLNTRCHLSHKIPSAVDRRAHDRTLSPSTHTCRKSTIDRRWNTRALIDLVVGS